MVWLGLAVCSQSLCQERAKNACYYFMCICCIDPLQKRGQSDTAARQAGSQAGRQAGPLPLDLTSGWKQPESDNYERSLIIWYTFKKNFTLISCVNLGVGKKCAWKVYVGFVCPSPSCWCALNKWWLLPRSAENFGFRWTEGEHSTGTPFHTFGCLSPKLHPFCVENDHNNPHFVSTHFHTIF